MYVSVFIEIETFECDVCFIICLCVFQMTLLSHVGGESEEEFVRRALKKLVADEIQVQYSWLGKKQKKNFSSLNIAKLITGNYYKYYVSMFEVVTTSQYFHFEIMKLGNISLYSISTTPHYFFSSYYMQSDWKPL